MSEYKVPGGKLVACELIVVDDIITKIKFSGDFFMHPEKSIEDLENILQGKSILSYETIIKEFFLNEDITLVGIEPYDFVFVVKLAIESKNN